MNLLWTEEDRERIALYRQGYSLQLIATMRKATVVEVQKSVSKYLDLVGETESE